MHLARTWLADFFHLLFIRNNTCQDWASLIDDFLVIFSPLVILLWWEFAGAGNSVIIISCVTVLPLTDWPLILALAPFSWVEHVCSWTFLQSGGVKVGQSGRTELNLIQCRTLHAPPLSHNNMSSPTPRGMGWIVDNFLLDHVGLHHVLDRRSTWDTSLFPNTQELFWAYVKTIFSRSGPLNPKRWGPIWF